MINKINFKSTELYFGGLGHEKNMLGSIFHNKSVGGVNFTTSSATATIDVTDLITTVDFGGESESNKIAQILVEGQTAILCGDNYISPVDESELEEYINIIGEKIVFKSFANNNINMEVDFTLNAKDEVTKIILIRTGI